MTSFFKVTSITKKVCLAIIGLFLMSFLLIHAGINLCILRGDEGEWFYAAAHFMGTNYIIKVFEVVLFAAIILHILLGVVLTIQNKISRPVGYKIRNKSKSNPGSKLMFVTGLLVAGFLVLHMFHFYFVKAGFVEGTYVINAEDIVYANQEKLSENPELLLGLFNDEDVNDPDIMNIKERATNVSKADLLAVFGPDFKHYEPDFYNMSKDLFSNIWYSLIYVVLIIFLGVHLNHAFYSAFQTFGLNSRKYTPTIKLIGLGYSVLVTLMFCVIPIYIYFFI